MLTNYDGLCVEKGRHLAHEQLMLRGVERQRQLEGVTLEVPKRHIPIDTKIEDSSNESSLRIAILSGPSMSGKTLYLKSIALSVYLAHAGIFVPA